MVVSGWFVKSAQYKEHFGFTRSTYLKNYILNAVIEQLIILTRFDALWLDEGKNTGLLLLKE